MNMSDDCLAALVRLYKVTCVTALSEMVGMDGTPNNNQLDASIEAGVRAVAEAVGKGLAPASPRAVPDGWRETILSVLSALDVATGDSDPNIDPDMNDDEVREEYPEVWAMQQLSAMLAAAPPIDAPGSKR